MIIFCLCVHTINHKENCQGEIVSFVFDEISLLACYKLTHSSLASLLWDIGKQNSPRCDAAERGVPSGAILFAQRNFIEKMR